MKLVVKKMWTRRIGSFLVANIFFLSILVSSGCIGQEEEPPSTTTSLTTTIQPEAPLTVKAQVSPSGGTVGGNGGASVVLPQGALTQDTEITVSTYETLDTVSDKLEVAAPLFGGGAEFGPGGLEFQKPVIITIPTTFTLEPGAEYPLFLWDEDEGQWWETSIMATANPDGSSVTTEITHFTTLGLFKGPPELQIMKEIQDFLGSFEDPYGALADYIEWFMTTIDPYSQRWIHKGHCYGVVGVDFTVYYVIEEVGQADTMYVLDGEKTITTVATYRYAETISIEYLDTGRQVQILIDITVNLFLGCVPELIVEADRVNLNVDEITSITAHLWCGGQPLPQKQITFSVIGPGEVDVTDTMTSDLGEASVTFTAKDGGVAVVTATHMGCVGGLEQKEVSDSVEIVIEAEPQLTLDAMKTTLQVSEQTTLTARLLNGTTPMTDKMIEFSLSGPGRGIVPASSRTTANGEAKVSFIATDEGIAIVTATYEDLSANVEITIEKEEEEPTSEIQQWTGTLIIEYTGSDPSWVWEGSMVINFDFKYYWPLESSPHYPFGNIYGTGSATQNFWIESVDPECSITGVQARSFDVVLTGLSLTVMATPPLAHIIIRQPLDDPLPIIVFSEECDGIDTGSYETYFALIDYYDEVDDDDHQITIRLEDGAHAEGTIVNPDDDGMLMFDATYRVTINRIG